MAPGLLVSPVPEPYSREATDEFMAANISAIGLVQEPGGLEESLAKFRMHHKEVGDALLNLSGVGTIDGHSAKLFDPRPVYNPKDNPFPRMLHHADGRQIIVKNEAEEVAQRPLGFRRDPYARVQVAMADPQEEKARLMRENAELKGQMTTLQERMEKLETAK